MPADAAAQFLPPLRNDLKLIAGPRAADGSATWTIHDPVRDRFFRIGWHEFEVLARWAPAQAKVVAERIRAETPLVVTPEEVEAVGRFLEANELSTQSRPRQGASLSEKANKARQHPLVWLLHHYLFVRIPVVHPDRFLETTLPYIAFVFTAWFRVLVLVAALLGLYLVVRQWDLFTHTFLYFFTWEGTAYYGAALVFAKIIHELGHAYTAKRYGLRVPSIGVAFLVMFPVLYTDTSDAWRLTRRRPFLAIGLAGMAAELGLAAGATLAWSFLPDGPLKSAVFLLATTTWIMTLAVNLNPFMRFDGYYLLADFLGIPNLQSRAFRLARWRLRELLFKFQEPCPEPAPVPHYLTMLAYAYATWVYRFFLFLGIAVLVYLLFFKVLGIFLMAVEVWWFILRPIVLEMKEWWDRRDKGGLNLNVCLTFAVLTAAVAGLLVPWHGRITVPAFLHAGEAVDVFTPTPGRITALTMQEGNRVPQGDPLLRLEWPELDFREAKTHHQIDILKWQIARSESQAKLSGQAGVLAQQLVQTMTQLDGIAEERRRLTLAAPLAGRIADWDPNLHPGRWLPAGHRVARVVAEGDIRVTAYLNEDDLVRVMVGAEARFHAEGEVLVPISLTVTDIDTSATQALPKPYLASDFGGPLAVRQDPRKGTLVPEESIYRVTLRPTGEAPRLSQIIRGTVYLEGQARSAAGRVFRFAAGVLIRESGF